MLINYRYYSITEMLELLTRDPVYFSRGSFIDRWRYPNPDVISLHIAKNADNSNLALAIVCEVYKNPESIGEILLQSGFIRDSAAKKYTKQRLLVLKSSLDAVKLAGMIIAKLDEALQEMPFYMYALPAQRALADYHAFMTAGVPKIGLSDLMRHLGCLDEYAENAGCEASYMVAKYKKGRWAAWVSGDRIVPLFASDGEARQFLIDRVRKVNGRKPEGFAILELKKAVCQACRRSSIGLEPQINGWRGCVTR